MNKFKKTVLKLLLKAFKINTVGSVEYDKFNIRIPDNILAFNSEHPFFELLENVNLIAVFLDLNGKVVYCNSYLLTLTGFKLEELIGADWFELIIPEANSETKAEFLKGLKSGIIANHLENPILTKSGKQQLIFWNNTLLRDATGTVTGTASIGEDITQRRFFEKALINTKEDLEANEKIKSDLLFKMNEAQRSAKIGSWDWDMVTNEVWWSDELYRIFEVSPKNFIPSIESNAKYVHPEDNIPYHTEVQRVIKSKEELNYDLRIITSTGKIKFCNSRAKLEFDEDGNPIRFHGTFSDITGRKEIETALMESEERFRNAFNNIPDVIVIYDNNLKIRHINAATLRVSGRPISDFIGKRDDEIWPREVYQAYLPSLEKALKSGEICSVETKLDLKNNKIQYLRITCIPILNERGSVHEVMGITHDFTERKQAEENIQSERDFSNALLDGLPGIFYFYDTDYKFLRWNKNFETVSGYSGNEITKMVPLDFFSDSKKDLLKERISEVFTKGYSKVEADFLAKDGTRTPYFFNGFKFNYNNKDCLIGIGIDIAQQKRAEAAVRESEERYRTIISNIPGGLIHIFDRDMRYVFNAGEELMRLGLSNEMLVGKSIYEVLPADLASIVESKYKRVLAGETVRFEGEYGEDYFSLTSAPLWNTNGEIENILTLSVNITERKRTEQNLAESEKRYRSLFENMNAGFVLFEVVQNAQGIPVDLIVTAANEGFGKTTGLKLRDSIGMHLTQVLPGIEKDEADWIGTYSKVALSGESVQFEQGSELLGIYYSISAFHAGPKQCAVTFVDITERKNAELDLIRMSRIMKNSQEIAHLGSFEYVAATQTTIWSEEEYRIYGLDPDGPSPEYSAMLEKCIHPDDAKLLHDTFVAAMQNQEVYELEHRIVRPDGSVRWVYDKAHPYFDENGNLLRYVGATLDITERKHLLEELENLNSILELKVEQRTALLEASNKELETFSYSVSHDLRAPLRAIYGFSQILAGRHRDSLNEEGTKYIDYIVESSIRMEQLINDLLNYSRLGRKTVDMRTVSLKKIIDDISDDFKPQIDEIGGQFEVIDSPPVIPADESLLRQIFSNLVGNAIKYRRTDKALLISISFETMQDSILIKVADNGIGIPMEYSEKIFNVFQRLHGEDKYPGTGIGLANVKKAVFMLGGTIYVESTVGKGSTFIIKFPNK